MRANLNGLLRYIGLTSTSFEDRSRRRGIREVEQFFAEDDRPGLAYPMLAFFVSTFAIIASAAWLLVFLNPDLEAARYELPFELGSIAGEKAAGILDFLSTIFVSLGASVLAVMLINRVNLAKIKFIKDLTEPEAVKTVLKNLKSYGGRYSESKHVELAFEGIEFGEGNFAAIKVTQTVRLRMPIQRKELILDFVKLDRSVGGHEASSITYDLQSDAVPDDAQSIDITDIRRCFPDSYEKMFPGLQEVIIASQPQPLVPEFVDDQRNHRRWRFDTKKFVGEGLVDVAFRYCYYQEATGFAYQDVSEPTRGFFYSLNYEAVAEHINVYRIGSLNARESGQDVKTRGHRQEVATSEWVVPSTLIVFCWYRKGHQTVGPPPAPSAPKAEIFEQEDPLDVALGNGLRNAEAAGLSIDGNCLAVALLDVQAILDAPGPEGAYESLSTPADAVAAIKALDGIAIALIARGGLFSRPFFAMQAWRFGVPLVREALQDGEAALCLRSMRQLYGVNRPEAHWVVVTRRNGALMLVDRLARSIEGTFLHARLASAQEVLEATGATIRISKI